MIADMDPPTNSSGLGINFCLNLFGVDFKIKKIRKMFEYKG